MNNYDYYDPFNNYFMNQENNQNTLFGPYEGYIKGNMFRNLYEQYKNYKPSNVSFSSEKEEALFNLNQICFAMHDINLYLDVHPNDTNMLNMFVNYENTYNNLLKDYQEKYGPINVDSVNNNTPFTWVTTNFPWEVK
jgi:spore coat protein JB